MATPTSILLILLTPHILHKTSSSPLEVGLHDDVLITLTTEDSPRRMNNTTAEQRTSRFSRSNLRECSFFCIAVIANFIYIDQNHQLNHTSLLVTDTPLLTLAKSRFSVY